MTQMEFDKEMFRLNAEQNEKTRDMKQQMDDLNKARHELQAQIYEQKLRVERISIHYESLHSELRRINCEYHARKHELIVLNLKEA